MNQLCSFSQSMPCTAAKHSNYCIYWNKQQFIQLKCSSYLWLYWLVWPCPVTSGDISPEFCPWPPQTLWTGGNKVRKHFQGGKLLELRNENFLCILQHKRGSCSSWKLRVSMSSTKALPTAALRIHVKPGFLGLERQNCTISAPKCFVFSPQIVSLKME